MRTITRRRSSHGPRPRSARREETPLVSPQTYEACVAHQAADLRNGLTPLVLLVGEVERHVEAAGGEPSWLAPWAACMRASLEAMIAKVDRLDAFPRVVPHSLALAPSELDLAIVVREVCARRAREAETRGAALQVADRGPVCGRWDRGGVRAIVDHLLSHALHIGARAPIDVDVGAAGRHATIAVTSRLPGGASATVDGGGLELWPVRLLCDGMRGDIDVAETADARARFTVTLPLS